MEAALRVSLVVLLAAKSVLAAPASPPPPPSFDAAMPVTVVAIPLAHTTPDQVRKLVGPYLSEDGKLTWDAKRRILLLTERSESVEQIRSLVGAIDQAPAEVETPVDAKVVAAVGVVTGNVNVQAIHEAYGYHQTHLQWLCGHALRRNPTWMGSLRMLIVTDATGRALAGRVVGGTMQGREILVEQDLVWHAMGVSFPETSDGRPAQIILELRVSQ